MSTQRVGERVTVRGEVYRVVEVRRVHGLGSKFDGKLCFDLVKVADGTRWGYLGKRVTVNARLCRADRL